VRRIINHFEKSGGKSPAVELLHLEVGEKGGQKSSISKTTKLVEIIQSFSDRGQKPSRGKSRTVKVRVPRIRRRMMQKRRRGKVLVKIANRAEKERPAHQRGPQEKKT